MQAIKIKNTVAINGKNITTLGITFGAISFNLGMFYDDSELAPDILEYKNNVEDFIDRVVAKGDL